MAKFWACLLLAPLLSAGDWPEFRGPTGQGIVEESSIPLEWSETHNVTWKSRLPGSGWSSPVVSEGEVWLTAATERGRSLRAVRVDGASGELELDVEVFRVESPLGKHQKNSFASPSPVVRGDRIYVHFGSRGTAALTRNGEVVWRNTEHRYNDVHGSGGSPVLWNDLLVFNCDGADRQYVAALNAQTGQTVWTAPRRTNRFSFSTPLLIPRGESGEQLISAGADVVASYDPATGEELWRIAFNGYSVVPRPVFGEGLVFLSTGFDVPVMYAVRTDGSGDVTDTHVAWTHRRGAPRIPSMLYDDGRVYMINENGIVTCLSAADGRELWRRRLPGAYAASPALVGDRIYFTNEVGLTTVIESSEEYVELAQNQVQGDTYASLAFADGAVFLRSSTGLYRIEE